MPPEEIQARMSGPQTAGSSASPFFRLPIALQSKIWENASDGPHYIVQSPSVRIRQMPPVIAHVCRLSRHIALETGRVYQLGDGTKTWFNPAADVVLWGGNNPGLGELSDHVRNIAIPRPLLDDYSKAFNTFAMLLEHGVSQLKHVFVNMETKFALLDSDAKVASKVFDLNTIAMPNLNKSGDQTTRIDSVISLLPQHIAEYWYSYRETDFEYENEWEDIQGDIVFAWYSAVTELTHEIPQDRLNDFEKETLMHSNGQAPIFWPTFLFIRFSGQEKAEINVEETGDFEGVGGIEAAYDIETMDDDESDMTYDSYDDEYEEDGEEVKEPLPNIL
ncbi:hypothetical protein F4677DRAFT_445559 [Hypoxylon crocopeplum]|nr:hypothetical protein F4677DRAFT_445559 [Hypoxylon crocopeplum]